MYFDDAFARLAITQDDAVGGAAVEWASWVKGFARNGFEVLVYTTQEIFEQVEPDALLDFKVIRGYKKSQGLKYLRWFYYRLPHIVRTVLHHRPLFLVQECCGTATGLVGLASKLANVPFVYRMGNDMEVDDRIKQRLNRWQIFFYMLGVRLAEHVICQNSYQFEKMHASFPHKHITVIHNPIEPAITGNAIKHQDRKYIAWVGIFQRQKNLPALLELATKLPDVHFRIAGKASAQLDPETSRALENLALRKNVEFAGFLNRSDIYSFLSPAFALVNTSHYEGFSNTFLEAWSVGTPVISTENVNPDGLITSKRLGLIAKDHQELAHSVMSIIQNEELFDTLSKNCILAVSELFSPSSLAQRFVSFIEKRDF